MITLLLVVASAVAQPISSGFTLITGVGATFDGDPATVNLEIQGEVPLSAGDVVGFGIVLPLLMTTSGREAFGISTGNTMVTFIPSLRLRTMNASPLRLYADAGIGVAELTGSPDNWMLQTTASRTGWSARIVGGIEVGPADGGVAVVFEPIVINTLQFKERKSAGYAGRIGIGFRY